MLFLSSRLLVCGLLDTAMLRSAYSEPCPKSLRMRSCYPWFLLVMLRAIKWVSNANDIWENKISIGCKGLHKVTDKQSVLTVHTSLTWHVL